jgi:hypothetical protein
MLNENEPIYVRNWRELREKVFIETLCKVLELDIHGASNIPDEYVFELNTLQMIRLGLIHSDEVR